MCIAVNLSYGQLVDENLTEDIKTALKADRSFVRNLPECSEDKAIAEAILSMGKTLSLRVVAEGMETKEQMTYLNEHCCDEMQGFYFSKPIAPEKFAELLNKHIAFARGK